MTEYTGGGPGTFIEIAVPVENDYNQWDCHYHFRVFDEVAELFSQKDYEFFSVGDCEVIKCADDNERGKIEYLYERCGEIALQLNQKAMTLDAVNKGLAASQRWIQFYNDVIAQAPHVMEQLAFHKQTIDYAQGTIAQLEKDVEELRASI